MRVTGTGFSRDSLLDAVALLDAHLRGDTEAIECLLANTDDPVNLAELLAAMAADWLRQHDRPESYVNRLREEFLR
ncbi:MAG: hypothetical protein H0T99_09625 [Geodermatophilaceae bacterium]|nr:hypothetical protein [Geodermatophilaceae bacterium]